MRPLLQAAAVAATLLSPALAAPPGDEAIRLRNRGLAELENEQPAEAEATFRELIAALPDEPLGWANLAISGLRQQKFDDARAAIAEALQRAPADPRLLAIRGEIEQWSGDQTAALDTFRRAADGAPRDPEIQFALYRLASILDGEAAGKAAAAALERLQGLRPDNLVVLMQSGLAARAAGDRAAATAAFLRVRELAWQAPPSAAQLLEQILEALEADDLDAARVPAIRLENVLKITAMHRESQRELSSGIQGVPLERFRDEPPPSTFGEPVPVAFRGQRLAAGPTLAVEAADLDDDGTVEILRLVEGDGGTVLEIRPSDAGEPTATLPAAGRERLRLADLDNDGRLDVLASGRGGITLWRGTAEGWQDATEALGLAGAAGPAVAVIDFDIEGDLDLVVAGGQRMEIYRNALAGPLEAVGERVLPAGVPSGVSALVESDLDRDGDLDLAAAHPGGLVWLDNLRQGRFRDLTADAGLATAPGAAALAVEDFDLDGLPDLAAAGRGLAFLRNRGGRFEPWSPGGGLATSARFTAVEPLDADNDGRLDLAVAGENALVVLALRAGDQIEFLNLDGAPAGARDLAAADLDGDGDLDLVAGGADGLWRLDNDGGNANRWLAVGLRGLDKGNSKNNLFGLGSSLEVRAGSAYQFREARRPVTHFGLGSLAAPDLLRVVWTNGVPQNRLAPKARQTIVEEQLLKGSCPFLYAWDGESIRFVTDLLWGAPAGLPVAAGVWAGADPEELVVVEGARPRDGVYDLRVTEELWEAAFFDYVRLWVVDHPPGVEVATSLKILPGRTVDDRVLGTRDVRPVAAAWDARGRPVGDRVAARDEVYADGWRRGRYQGLAAEPWTFTFDLGEAPASPVRLLLDGWIFPSDASLNLAIDQRGDLVPIAPALEVETVDGWRTLMAETGFPAGKTKTMVIDTPPLPPGARRLRLVSNLWLSWDRIAWSPSPADELPAVVARLAPARAELRYRGFSAPRRETPNGPHVFDYARLSTDSPWLPFPGRYTRFGDVAELLAEPDDRSVILAAGDELALAFDASRLPPPRPGWSRTVILESHGWDKDADRNTFAAEGVEPLPFRAMSGYPWGPDEAFPDTPLHREYRERWLTREVPASPR